MTKINILFLKSPPAEKLWAVSLGYSAREESGEFMKRHQVNHKELSSRIFPESENRLWPLVATSHEKKRADYEHDGNFSWERMIFSMQSIAWEQMIQKELKFPKTWRSTGFAYLFSMPISCHSFPLSCNTYHTCFSLTCCFLFHPCFQSSLMTILTAGFSLIGLHVSQP